MAAREEQQGPPSVLWLAARTGEEAAVRELPGLQGNDLEAGQGTQRGTPLFAAAYSGHSSIVELLLQAGANVNAQGINGYTPLHLAAENGWAAMARTLIAAGANVNSAADLGLSPLHCAGQSGKLEVARMLIEAGADIDSTAKNDATVLHWATRSQTLEPGLIPYLLAAGAERHLNANEKTCFMPLMTPLMMACAVGNKTAVEHLLKAGADTEAKPSWGSTALHVASVHGRAEIIELLIAAGADTEATTDMGCTPIEVAIHSGHGKVAALIHAAAVRRGERQNGAEALR